MRSLTAAISTPASRCSNIRRIIPWGAEPTLRLKRSAPIISTGRSWPPIERAADSRRESISDSIPATSGPLSGKGVEGVRWLLTSREAFDSVRLGLEVGAALQALYPGKISFGENRKLICSEGSSGLYKLERIREQSSTVSRVLSRTS